MLSYILETAFLIFNVCITIYLYRNQTLEVFCDCNFSQDTFLQEIKYMLSLLKFNSETLNLNGIGDLYDLEKKYYKRLYWYGTTLWPNGHYNRSAYSEGQYHIQRLILEIRGRLDLTYRYSDTSNRLENINVCSKFPRLTVSDMYRVYNDGY
jgi:hypothetical protein